MTEKLKVDTCYVIGYITEVIKTFTHKGLQKFYERGTVAGITPEHARRLRQIMALLDTAASPEDMDLPGLNLHELKGRRKGTWSVKVSGKWRVTFVMKTGDVFNVHYEDYH